MVASMPAFLFDPLRFLRTELYAEVLIGQEGIELRFTGRVEAHQRSKAMRLAKFYEKLLRLQIENQGASVQKLLGQGKIKLEGGRYYLGGSS